MEPTTPVTIIARQAAVAHIERTFDQHMPIPTTLTTAASAALIAQIAEAMAKGEYNLLLGAGASIGGKGGDGRPLPSANTLIKELIADFDVPADPSDTSLAAAYEAAGRRKDGGGHSRETYLSGRFMGCTPPNWFSVLPRFVWKRVWTLNIDDALEVEYLKASEARQEIDSLNWSDKHTDSAGQLQVVHLHGIAAKSADLVFSIVQYVRATAAHHAWHWS